MKKYFKTLGNATSQWLNALSGGNPDIPMSGRVGYYAIAEGYRWFSVLEWVIDAAFYPIDGPNHCHMAFMSDEDEQLSEGNVWSFAFVSIFSLAGSVLIMPFTWTYQLIKWLRSTI